MRVLHINGNYIWTTLHQLMIRELSSKGIDNDVYVPTYDKKNAVIDVDDNVVIDECFKKNDRFLYFHKQSKIIAAAEKCFNLKTFDLIHAYTLFTDGNTAMQLSKKYGIPYVVAVRNTDIYDFFKYRILLRHRGIEVLQNASAVFFLSDSYRQITINQFVSRPLRESIQKKSYIIPNGIDNFWFDNIFRERNYDEINLRISKKELRLIYAGSIDNNKNTDLTIEAIEKLKNNGWEVLYTVVGHIIDENVADRLRQKSYVTLVDKMPKEDLIKLYRDADIFIMPSHKESFGLVYAEAMTQGLPVIYTRGQGFDGQFVEGSVGYSVSDKDSYELTHLIEMITEKYREISCNCVGLVNKFRWDTIVHKYIDVYSHLC